MTRRVLPFALLFAGALAAQTSQATLAGLVRDAQGQPLAGARIAATHEDTGRLFNATSNAQGEYTLPFLPLGSYLVRVQARGLRPLTKTGVNLHVAQLETADFQLESLPPGVDPGAFAPGAEAGVGLIYGPDAQRTLGVVDARAPMLTDATSSTVSGVIDDNRVHELPLNGRDIYTLFVVMPGVTSDNATQRGLGFSVNGFPVSSANYLLDGIDNNNVRTTFPVTLLSPDGIEEYRLATNSFSAEYGRGAFVANVVTRAGGNRWHGQLFEFLINEALSAHSFQENLAGLPKSPFKEHQFGGTLGGPLRRDRTFLFASIEALEAGTRALPKPITLPTPAFISSVKGPIARNLFSGFPAIGIPNITASTANTVTGPLALPIPFSSLAASGRLDMDLRPDRDSIFVRFGSFDESETAQVSPYQGLEIPFVIAARNLGAGWIHRFGSSRVNEAKLGWNHSLNEQVPQVPGVAQLQSSDHTSLPGNADSTTEQSYSDNLLHAVENFSLLLARHHIVAGGDFQSVWNRSFVAPGRIGSYNFDTLADFGADHPSDLMATIDRFHPKTPRDPDYARQSRHSEFGLFVQDNWRVSPRLTLNLGLRYESFGAPAPEINLVSATLTPQPSAFRRDGNNFAPRAGAAFDLFGNSRTILRGGYGIFYDRVFQQVFTTLLQNSYLQEFWPLSDVPFRYAFPVSSGYPSAVDAQLGPAAYVDPNLRTPYVHSWFAGVQQAIGQNTVVEINHTGTRGRSLITRDQTNRDRTKPSVFFVNSTANQGTSDFTSLQTSVLRRFHGGLQFQAAWTWSHAIDNQGDPLIGAVTGFQGFQRQGDAHGDRGNADFDQRHNVIFNWVWRTPRAGGRWFGNWQLAGIAGYRGGFPLTVYSEYGGASATGEFLLTPRASLISSNYGASTPVKGGLLLLNASSFLPAFGTGNTTRGEFRGPGFWNYDASIAREFPVRKFGEASRLQVRGEFFNLFNHANLGPPDTRLASPTFGTAFFGRAGTSSAAVGTAPLNDTPRRIQLALRLNF